MPTSSDNGEEFLQPAMPAFLGQMGNEDRENLVTFVEGIAGQCTLDDKQQLQRRFNINESECSQVLEWINTNKTDRFCHMDTTSSDNITFNTHCTSVSIQGGRTKNEDTADYNTMEDDAFGKIVFCMVADGHGGAAVSKMLKRETQPAFLRHFAEGKERINSFGPEDLDDVMTSTLENMNIELQGYCSQRNLSGGSTLVAVFNFERYRRCYVLNVGDSRCMLMDTATGEIINSTSRIIDLEDGRTTDYLDAPHPTCTHLHKVLGKIKIQRDRREELKSLAGKPGTWDPEFVKVVKMINDTPDLRGIREWQLFLNNTETNATQALEFVNNRKNDDELVIGTRQLPSTTRAFGDLGMTLHKGEIYICSIPTDRETAVFVGCDGFEESISWQQIPRYLATPQEQLTRLLSDDHKFVVMYRQYKEWFHAQRIGAFPRTKDIADELKWLLRCINLVGHSHLPSARDCEVISGAVQWLQWAYTKYSALSPDDPNNKFQLPFPDSSRFRLKFLVQCALARLSFDNISGVVISFTPQHS